MILRYVRLFILIMSDNIVAQKVLEMIRKERAMPYQGNYVEPRFFAWVRNGDKIPANAIRPFQRALHFGNETIDVVVALWIPDRDFAGVWGRAWQENNTLKAVFVHNNTVKTNLHPDLAKGFRILIYPGTKETNGFKFKWVQSGRADGGTVLFSGRVMNVPAIYVEDNRYEFLGNGDWFNKQMEFVVYGSQDFHTVGNFGRHRIFDNNVYVLTKQRCHCQCE